MRGVILLEGDFGDELLEVASHHPIVTTAFRSIGKFTGVLMFDGDMQSMRFLIGELNRMDSVWDGKTIIELEFGMKQPPMKADGHFRALLLFTEHGGTDPNFEQSFEEAAKTVPGVVDAFSLLGEYDGAALVRFDDMQDLQALVRGLQTAATQVMEVVLEQR